MSDIKRIYDNIAKCDCTFATLSNGIEVFHIPSSFSTSHAAFGVNYGSVHTSYINNGKHITTPDGTAHFLEHKLFDNIDGPVDDVFTSLGASCNAYTSFSHTVYTFSCTDNFNTCLDTLLHFVTDPFFTEQTVKKEQGIIGEEIKMYDDSPFWRCYFNMLSALYGDCPISHDIAGTVESISHITPEMLYELCSRFYTTDNLRLCINGEKDAEYILRAAESLPAKHSDAKKIPLILPKGISKPVITCNMETSKPLVYIGIKDDEYGKTSYERLRRGVLFQLIFEILFSESSDFSEKLYRDALISDRLQYGYEYEDEFAFGTVFCETDKPDEFYNEFCSYMDQISQNGLDKNDFEISKRIVYADYVRMFDSGEGLPSEMFVHGAELLKKSQIIPMLTVDEANALICEFFKEENFVLSVLGTDVE